MISKYCCSNVVDLKFFLGNISTASEKFKLSPDFYTFHTKKSN